MCSICLFITGEQLDDVVIATDGSGTFTYPTVLVMYEPTCADALVKNKIDLNEIPQWPYMLGFKHDWVTFSKYIWFDQKAASELTSRFNVKRCPTVLFMDKGSHYDAPTSIWNPEDGLSFKDWAWGKSVVKFKLTNKLGFDIDIKITGVYTKGEQDLRLKNSQETEIMTYPSLHVNVFNVESGQKVAFHIINGTSELILSETMNADGRLDLRTADITQMEIQKGLEVSKIVWGHVERWLICIKQPLFLPRYTSKGYEVRKIPRDIYNALNSFYNLGKAMKSKELWIKGDAVLNQDDSPCDMVQLSENIKTMITNAMQHVLEKWCKCSLAVTAIYGIRIYNSGSVLRHHLDRVETHVISAILQVAQGDSGSVGERTGWPLELITSDGKRLNVSLDPGDMVLYESATLIHGRPYAFTGKSFANVFVHFKPTPDWGYSRDIQTAGQRLMGPTTSIPLFPLEEPPWFWKQHRHLLPKDEL